MRLNCATDTASSVGAMFFITRCTAGSFSACQNDSRMRGSMPMRTSDGTCHSSCSTPPIITPAARASTGGSKYGLRKSAARMMEMFSSTGANAGTAKRFHRFSTAAASATSEISRMYGNIQRVISTAMEKVCGSCRRPLATIHTSHGAASTPTVTTAVSTQNSIVATASSTRRVSSGECCWLCASTGTKACVKAPSANSRRSMLGRRKATKKASVSAPAP